MPTDVDLKTVSEQLSRTLKNLSRGRSRYPYYNEHAAGEVIETVHTVLSGCKPVVWAASSVSVQTLYTRFRQGAQYVQENLDPEFGDKLRTITITRIPKVGLRIAPREGIRALVDPDMNWRGDLDKFLEEAQPGNTFERINLPLSQDAKDWIAETMYPLRHLFLTEVNENRLLIIRLHDSQGDTRPAHGRLGEVERPGIDPTAWATDPTEQAGG